MKAQATLDGWMAAAIGAAEGQGSFREQLAAWQLERLRETVDRCLSASPYYRRTLSCLPGRRIRRLEDLLLLPLLSDADLKREGLSLVCVPQDEIARIVTLQTSGTTGTPKRVYFTQGDQELTADFFQHGMATFVEPGSTVLVLMPGERPGSVGDLLRTGLGRDGVETIVHGFVDSLSGVSSVLQKREITAVVGIPKQVRALACYLAWRGERPSALKSVLLSADYVSTPAISAIRSAWGAAVFEHYGMTEMGLGGGVSCRFGESYHLREADLLFEIVDPQTGVRVPDGEYGEVVFTTLTRTGMPLIRYRTGDRSRWLTASCPCGSLVKRLERIRCRSQTVYPLGEGLTISVPELDELLYADRRVLDYQASLRLEGGAAFLSVVLACLPGAGTEPVTAARGRLLSHPPLASAAAASRLAVEVSGMVAADYGFTGPPKSTVSILPAVEP